jgi:hypothetical protein
MEAVRLKPHLQVKDEMAGFMTEVAPAFAGSPAESPERRDRAPRSDHILPFFRARPNSIVIRLIGRIVDGQRSSLIRK